MTTHQPQAPGSDSHGTRWAIHPSRVLGGGIRVAGESTPPSMSGSLPVRVGRNTWEGTAPKRVSGDCANRNAIARRAVTAGRDRHCFTHGSLAHREGVTGVGHADWGSVVRIHVVHETPASVSLLFLAETKKAVARMPVLVKTTVSKSVVTALEWAAARQSRDIDRKRTANPNPTTQVESLRRCSGLPDSITASRRR